MKRIVPLDGLRGLAAAWVMVVHYSGLHPAFGSFPVNTAQLGVMVFFVLSGFLMAELTLRQPATPASVGSFYLRRFARIGPLWLIVIAASALLVKYGPHWHWHLYFDKSSSFVNNLLLKEGPHVLWTIAVEVKFYLLWPIIWGLMIGFGQSGKWIPLLIIVALFSGISAPFGSIENRIFSELGAWFLAGAALSAWLPRTPRLVWDIATLAGLGLFVVTIATRPTENPYWMWTTWYCLGASSLVMAGAMNGRATRALLSARPLIWLGTISYSLYLIHMPVMWYLRRFTQLDETGPDWRMWAIAVPLAIIVSCLSHALIESPFRKAINSLAKQVHSLKKQLHPAIVDRAASRIIESDRKIS